MSLPVPQPLYILRGHGAQIHATTFVRHNARLVTADADGWVVVWSLASKRPVAVWRAHEGTVLGVEAWGDERLITHGRDNRIVVWKFGEEDEADMSTVLPIEQVAEPRRQPWLLYVIEVNAMNFCSFGSCKVKLEAGSQEEKLLVAVPNTLNTETVDIFEFPSSRRIYTLPKSPSTTVAMGMVMSVSLFYRDTRLVVVAGHESGYTSVAEQSTEGTWHYTYVSKPHDQPILSVCVSPSQDFYFSSSADALIAKHPIPHTTHHSQTRTATAQTQTHVSSQRSLSEALDTSSQSTGSLLSQAFANADSSSSAKHPPTPPPTLQTTPLKVVQTRHAGQQDLKIRNDGKIFATGGWDGRARVYSVKTMKEKAVLKWHVGGCFAISIAEVGEVDAEAKGEVQNQSGEGKTLVPTTIGLSVGEQRRRKAEMTHWIAVGGKDGKISLWEIF